MKTKVQIKRSAERWKQVKDAIKAESAKIREEKEKTPSKK